MVKTLVEKGLAVEVLDETAWWRRLDHLPYLHHSQYLLLGHLTWIISHMEKVSLNAKTRLNVLLNFKGNVLFLVKFKDGISRRRL